MSDNTPNTEINNVSGDFSIGHNSEVGGHQRVRGNSTVDHNMIVKGWLRAWNIESMFLGFFVSLEDAPDGKRPGNYIFVKDADSTTIASIYYWTVSGWVDSGMDTTLPTNVNVEETTIPYEAVFESGEVVNETEIIDNTTTDSAHDCLSAKQGKKIWDRIVPVVPSLSASLSNPVEYTGSDIGVILTWGCKRDGVNKIPSRVVIKKDGVTVETVSTPLSHTGTYGSTVNKLNASTLVGDTVFTAEITADGLTEIASVTIRQVLPSYVGFYVSGATADAMKGSLTKKLVNVVSGLSGTYTNDSNTKYLTILVPNNLTIGTGKVSSSKVSIPMNPAVSDTSITVGGAARTYKVYRSVSTFNAGDKTILVEV